MGSEELWKNLTVPLRLRVSRNYANVLRGGENDFLGLLMSHSSVEIERENLAIVKYTPEFGYGFQLAPFTDFVGEAWPEAYKHKQYVSFSDLTSFLTIGVISWRPPFPNPKKNNGVPRLSNGTLKSKVRPPLCVHRAPSSFPLAVRTRILSCSPFPPTPPAFTTTQVVSCASVVWKLQQFQLQSTNPDHLRPTPPYSEAVVISAYLEETKKAQNKKRDMQDPGYSFSSHGIIGAVNHVSNFHRLLAFKGGKVYYEFIARTREGNPWTEPAFPERYDLKASTRQVAYYLTSNATTARNKEHRTLYNGFLGAVPQRNVVMQPSFPSPRHRLL